MTFFCFFLLRRRSSSTGSVCLHATIVLTFFSGRADTLETYYHFDTTACLLDAQRHRGVRFFS
jgi:hypothetical protein